jgi:hypothetical protein
MTIKNETLRVIHIDAKNRTVTEVLTPDGLSEWYRLIGCQLITVGTDIEVGAAMDSIFVDDEGLYNATEFFYFEGAHQPFAGSGVIVGFDPEDGETISCHMTLEFARENITFMDWNEAARFAAERGM